MICGQDKSKATTWIYTWAKNYKFSLISSVPTIRTHRSRLPVKGLAPAHHELACFLTSEGAATFPVILLIPFLEGGSPNSPWTWHGAATWGNSAGLALRPTEALGTAVFFGPGRDADLEAFSHNPTNACFVSLATRPST